MNVEDANIFFGPSYLALSVLGLESPAFALLDARQKYVTLPYFFHGLIR
jgi:hypothetical protein